MFDSGASESGASDAGPGEPASDARPDQGPSIRWLTVFLNFRPVGFGPGIAHWQGVTGYGLSDRRGRHEEFATLLPAAGDPYLRVQRLAGGASGCHLDLHSDDHRALADWAARCGADRLAELDDVTVLRSPGGLPFCTVGWAGERRRPGPADWPGGSSVVDQLAIDIPPDRWTAEVDFWATLTGWELRAGSRAEFASLLRPTGLPIRLLLHRLATTAPAVTAHPDLACDDIEAEAERHSLLNAVPIRTLSHWITLRDPSGLVYCLTSRSPITGTR